MRCLRSTRRAGRPFWLLVCLATIGLGTDDPAYSQDGFLRLPEVSREDREEVPVGIAERVALQQCPPLLGNLRPLSTINLRIDASPEVPDCATQLFQTTASQATMRKPGCATEFHWAASNLCHQPLYFDETPLERYGQGYHPLLQPWFSGAHFFASVPLVPYKIALDRTHDHVYTRGYYRPGSPTPCLAQRIPLPDVLSQRFVSADRSGTSRPRPE